ncbi:hypothetical protein [Pedobacter xixiisoli]|uniref:Uncharacterized protein n=1 Tax=Pedobacter xixiisoli TaxID=1476464 RepID=A0A285ZUL2_9SPHI|nr:hypothetical protein [Pedobacter xixiisoli]SOD13343.1 hypothetical protein SAMN06297358_1170 [Pedobacter xixiisoli]
MAVGIDKTTHKKLIEGLLHLSNGNEQASHWKTVLDDLQRAYDETIQVLRLAQLTAATYNEIQASIRTQVAIELRNRKRRERFTTEETS